MGPASVTRRPGRVRLFTWVASAALLLSPASESPLQAAELSDLFRTNFLKGLAPPLAPLAPALANAIALTYPTASASSSVVYVFNPEVGTYERENPVLGPIIGERADTIGRGQFNLAASYSYVHLTSIDGKDLGSLENRPTVKGRVIALPVTPPVHLRDGRLTNFLPARVVADIDAKAHIVTPQITYGLTPRLDVNLAVPLVRSTLRIGALVQVPDPRLPEFALPPGSGLKMSVDRAVSDSAEGIGDVLLRAKYVLVRDRPFDIAAGVGLALPTGAVDDLRGTGHTRVQPNFIVSRLLTAWLQPLLNAGLDIDADAVERSSVRWTAGALARIRGPLGGALVFLGRHELSEQTEKLRLPFFFQVERNDVVDASVGARYQFGTHGVVAANALVPLNRSGLRAEVSPTVEIAYVCGVLTAQPAAGDVWSAVARPHCLTLCRGPPTG